MSATNRGSVRKESDNYPTPESCILKLLQQIKPLDRQRIFEPTAGSGNICKVIRNLYPEAYIVANELRKEEMDNLQKYTNKTYNYDFFEIEAKGKFDVVITNPPYSMAQEVIEKCFTMVKEKGMIIMLLRLSFLESRKRFTFWNKYPVNQLYVLSERPSFINGRTDAAAYAWFVWDGSNTQTIKVI